MATTGLLISADAFHGEQLWGELFEVPLMSAMFLAMVWHASPSAGSSQEGRAPGRGAGGAARAPGALPARRLARAAHAGHDRARPPRGAAPSLRRSPCRRSTSRSTSSAGSSGSSSGCSCSRRPSSPTSSSSARSTRRSFLEDVLMRWSEVAPRAWRLGSVPARHAPSRPGGAADRARRAARERRQVHRGLGGDPAAVPGPRARAS